ncbi:MAG: NAD(P)H-dependent oxidoreductase [Lachnospirales bacterium]
MKITLINGSLPSYDYGLSNGIQVIHSTMAELGENVDIIELNSLNLPHFSGEAPFGTLLDILNIIQSSDGVIFAYTNHIFSPNAIMQNFLDYLTLPICKDLLKDKNCYILTASDDKFRSSYTDTVSDIVRYLGGYPSVITPLTKNLAHNLSFEEHKNIIEKQVEDFYRFMRQGRRFFISSKGYQNSNSYDQVTTPQSPLNSQIYKKEEQVTLNQNNVHSIKPQKQNPINDISKINKLYENNYSSNKSHSPISNQFTKEATVNVESSPLINNNSQVNNQNYGETGQQNIVNANRADQYFNQSLNNTQAENLAPNMKTAQQMTKSLEHYYKGHMDRDFKMDLSLSISGDEAFEGNLHIENGECRYTSGSNVNADVIVIATDVMWKNILNGNVSMQKSFMTGQIKVRGKFILLSKFDQLFKLS